MPLKSFGWFREMCRDESTHPSIHDFVRNEPHPDAERIVAYLKNGNAVYRVMKFVDDVLDPTSRTALFCGMDSDGVWGWRQDLAHYVEHYHLELPEEFIAHMRENAWTVPQLSEEEVMRLARGDV